MVFDFLKKLGGWPKDLPDNDETERKKKEQFDRFMKESQKQHQAFAKKNLNRNRKF